MAIAKTVGWAGVNVVIARQDDGSIVSVVTNIVPKIAITGTGSNFDLAEHESWFDFSQFNAGTPYDEEIAGGTSVAWRIIGRKIPAGASWDQIQNVIVNEIKTQAGIS